MTSKRAKLLSGEKEDKTQALKWVRRTLLKFQLLIKVKCRGLCQAGAPDGVALMLS